VHCTLGFMYGNLMEYMCVGVLEGGKRRSRDKLNEWSKYRTVFGMEMRIILFVCVSSF